VSNTQQWSEVLIGSFQQLWQGFITFVPVLVGAIIVFLIGWILALALEQVIGRVLKLAKLNEGLDKTGLNEIFKRAEMSFDGSAFVAGLVRWFVVLVFLLAAADILQLTALTNFLNQVLNYVPNIIVAALIILVSGVAGDILEKVVMGGIKASGFGYSRLAGSIARWAVLVFGFIAALQQLGIATAILQTFVTGVIAMFALGGALAFGLGGKDFAQDMLNRMREKVTER